jgi:hypothetical protein
MATNTTRPAARAAAAHTARPRAHSSAADTTQAVDAFMATLVHPHADAVQALRRAILAADPAIAEGIKWNAPSFRRGEYFATTHLRTKAGVGIILHLGAKVRAADPASVAIADPDGLLQWLAADRALVAFADLEDVRGRTPAFQAVLRQWLARLDETGNED